MRSWFRLILLSISMLGFAWLLASFHLRRASVTYPITSTLRVGWMDYYPYQFSQRDHNGVRREGLGVRLVENGFQRAGIHAEFIEMPFARQIEALKTGELDVVMLVTPTKERRQFGRFSNSYAAFQMGTFYHKGKVGSVPEEPVELATLCQEKQLRVAYPKAHVVPEPLRGLIDLARDQDRLVEPATANDCVEAVYSGSADIALVDDLIGFYAVRDHNWQADIGFQEIECPANPLCLMFNRDTVTSQTVTSIDNAFAALEKDGTYSDLVRTYLYPRVLGVLTQHQIFRIISIAAGVFAGFTGLLIAHREGYDWIGALILASCPAVGGGIMRDLVISRQPVGVVADPAILLAIAALVFFGGLFFRFAPKRWREALESMDPSKDPRLLYFDNLGLAAYTVTAVLIAMNMGCEPLWLWGPLLAVVQNGGGGIIRDLLLGRGGQIAILRGVIYGEIAFVWGLFLSTFFIVYSHRSDYEEWHMIAAVLGTMVGVLVTRSLVLARGWKAPLI